MDMNICNNKSITRNDILKISDLHKATFHKILAGKISIFTIREYYMNISRNKNSMIFCLKKDDELIGFIAGSKKLELSLKFSALLLIDLVRLVLIYPLNILEVSLLIKKIKMNSRLPKSKLLSIIIKDRYQAQGLGSLLLNKLEGFFEEKDIKEYQVDTDDSFPRAIPFYLKNGFKLAEKIERRTSDLCFLIKKLNQNMHIRR